MNIGILDVDGHNFPNLALMKISAWHKNRNDNVEFATMFGEYDIVYKSKVFSFTPDDEYCYNTLDYLKGGTGYNTDLSLSNEIEHICPDYDLYNCDKAYGLLTRGCIRKCDWCIVPKKEGSIKAHSEIEEFISDKKIAILMDNNVLASSHGIREIEKISKMNIRVDFNQGLDARLIDESIAKLLSKIKWYRFIRLSCDSLEMLEIVTYAIRAISIYTKREIFVYMIIQKDKIKDAIHIAQCLKRYENVSPFAQPYLDFNSTKKDRTQEQKDLCRWINIKSIFRSVDFKDYKNK